MSTARPWPPALGFLLLAAMIAGSFRLLVHPPRRAAAEAAETELRRLQSEPRVAPEELVGEAERLEGELHQARTRIESAWPPLSPPTDPDEVLHALRDAAARERVRILRLAPEAAVLLDRFRARAVVLTAEGTFFELLGFVEQVARLPNLVVIEEADFESLGESDGRVRARLTAVAVSAAGPPFPPLAADASSR